MESDAQLRDTMEEIARDAARLCDALHAAVSSEARCAALDALRDACGCATNAHSDAERERMHNVAAQLLARGAVQQLTTLGAEAAADTHVQTKALSALAHLVNACLCGNTECDIMLEAAAQLEACGSAATVFSLVQHSECAVAVQAALCTSMMSALYSSVDSDAVTAAAASRGFLRRCCASQLVVVTLYASARRCCCVWWPQCSNATPPRPRRC